MERAEVVKRLAALIYHAAGDVPLDEVRARLLVLADAIPEFALTSEPAEDVVLDRLFREWVTITHQRASVKFTLERRTKLRARLKTYTSVEIVKGFRGAYNSDFHRGENEDGKKYLDIITICRNDTQLEKFIEAARSSVVEPAPQQDLINQRNAAQAAGDTKRANLLNRQIAAEAGVIAPGNS